MKYPITNYALAFASVMLLPSILTAQNETPPAFCGWTAELNEGEPEPTGDPENQCFDIASVLTDCSPVYIRFNVHFFTDTDCEGELQITNSEQASAYEIAEKLINDANHVLANNQIQWQSPGAAAVCNPLRYVLSGVYIHCLSNAVGGSNTASLHFNWGVNKDTEINLYIANFPGAATGIGFPTYANIDWIETGNFNHEICHVFALTHTFDPSENCSDTPRVVFNWDKNCDGDVNDSGEQILQCWSYVDPDKLPGEAGFSDINNNGIHDCDEEFPCTPNPCCDWAFIDNNIMSYNSYKSSYTKCQLTKMLTDLAEHDCNYIEKIGGCPPPHAFISQTPREIRNTDYCSECIVLSASFNDTRHLLEIYQTSGGQLAYSSGWVYGPATNFCFFTNKSFSSHYLKPNTEYKVILTVGNDCNEEDQAAYTFTTPGPKCTLEGTTIEPEPQLQMRPNPAGNTIQVNFNANSGEKFIILATDHLNSSRMVLTRQYIAASGENQLDISVAGLIAGHYTLSVIGEYHLYQSHFIKF